MQTPTADPGSFGKDFQNSYLNNVGLTPDWLKRKYDNEDASALNPIDAAARTLTGKHAQLNQTAVYINTLSSVL